MSKTCTQCKEEKPIEDFYKHSKGKEGRSSWCKSCTRAAVTRYRQSPEGRKKHNEQNKKYQGTYLHNSSRRAVCLYWAAKKRAQNRLLDFDLTPEWLKERLDAGCALSGLPFNYTNGVPHVDSPSIDRIDSEKGYTQSNCRTILFGLNSFKLRSTDAVILSIMESVVKKKNG